MHMSEDRKWALDLYREGYSYDEIQYRTGVPKKIAYQLVWRETQKGKLQPARKPPESIKRKVIDTVKIGYLGRTFRDLDLDDVMKITNKIKPNETLTDTLIRIALRGK